MGRPPVTSGLLFVAWLGTALAHAQPALAPLGPADLVKEADKAPPAVATILRALARPTDELTLANGSTLNVMPRAEPVRPREEGSFALPDGTSKEIARSEIASIHYYEDRALKNAQQLVEPDGEAESLPIAEKLLRAVLRFHRAERQRPSRGDNPWQALEVRLSEQLLTVRRRLLQSADGEAWAERWLAIPASENPLRDEIRSLLVKRAQENAKAGNFAAARASLDRLEGEFQDLPEADPVRGALRTRAEVLLADAKKLEGAAALGPLQEAVTLWSRLPGLRDELEKRKGTYQVVHIAVPALPEFLSPATAATELERQVLDLLFESLVDARYDPARGLRYRPALAESVPAATGSAREFRLRRDAYWPTGERVTSADVRHTVGLLAQPELPGRSALWRELLEPPRVAGNPFVVNLTYRQGLLDPFAPLNFKILPQQFRGRPLTRADDPDFAKEPVGSGPFQYQGQAQEDGQTYAVFRANPHFPPANTSNVREIRLFAGWAKKPAPHLVLEPTAKQLATLTRAGGFTIGVLPSRRVHLLAVNHRHPSLANINVRRALGHALDRKGILSRHFTAGVSNTKQAVSVNGPFARGSWAAASAERVPEELDNIELARSFVKKAKKEVGQAEWTLKIPAGDERILAAAEEIAGQVTKAFLDAEVTAIIKVVPLPPRDLRAALLARDFELMYHHLEGADDPFSLWLLFDPHPDAVRAGGSNYLGYDGDATLQSLLRSALAHRQFSTVQETMHRAHAHIYEAMPFIPLWQVPLVIAAQSSLQTPPLDAHALFADAAQWKLTPAK